MTWGADKRPWAVFQRRSPAADFLPSCAATRQSTVVQKQNVRAKLKSSMRGGYCKHASSQERDLPARGGQMNNIIRVMVLCVP